MDVSTALTDYLFAIQHLAEKSQSGYQQRLTVFSTWCAEQNICLEQINNKQVQKFLQVIKATHKPLKRDKTELSSHTIAGYVGVIWTFLYWCLDDEEYQQYLKLQVVKAIKMPRKDLFIKHVFSNEELDALFQACSHSGKPHQYQLRDTAILALLLDTGLRSAELRSLTIGNVTLAKQPKEDSYVLVSGKGRKQREIPFGNRTRRALARYLRQYRAGCAKADPVFLSRHGGFMTHEGLRDALERLRDLSTLQSDVEVNPHKFRHTFATRFMANGGDIYDLSRLLGHTSVAITEGYLKSLSSLAVRTRKVHFSVLDKL